MYIIEETVFVDRPVAQVFAFVAEQHNAPRWQKGLHAVRKTSEGPDGVGTTHEFSRKIVGGTLVASNEYTEYEPNQKVGFRSTSGPMQFRACYLTEPDGTGTKLTMRLEIAKAKGFFGLLLPFIVRGIRRDAKINFVVLKNLLEKEAGSI